MKVAVVGAGVSGLTAARLLSRDHEVMLFEKAPRAGGHANTEVVVDGDTERYLDTGFIVFNDRTYPNFNKLLVELGIDRRPSEMSFSVHCSSTGLEYNGTSFASLFYQRRNMVSPRFMKMLADIVRFNKSVKRNLEAGDFGDQQTLKDYVDAGRYGSMFQSKYLLPMVSAIWSVSVDDAMQMPVRFFARFFCNHGLLDVTNRPQWYTVEGGSVRYVEKITAQLEGSVHVATPVVGIDRKKTCDHGNRQGVSVMLADGQQLLVDHVFVATHSDEALALLRNPTQLEREILGSITYSDNTAILHRDASLLPVRPRIWASWNYFLGDTSIELPTLTYNLDILQGRASNQPWCVSLNQDPSALRDVHQVYEYSHPAFDTAAVDAQTRKPQICGVEKISYCGAYWGYGFHEDGVSSAIDAVSRFNQFGHQNDSVAVGGSVS